MEPVPDLSAVLGRVDVWVPGVVRERKAWIGDLVTRLALLYEAGICYVVPSLFK